jgi:hypothetical protein
MKHPLSILIILSTLLLAACASPTAQNSAVSAAQSLKVSGGDSVKTFTRADLEALPVAQAAFKAVNYKGVTAPELVKAAGYDPAQVKAIKAVASDGFTVNYDPSQILTDSVIIAYATTDGNLSADDGAFRMVLPNAEGKLNVRKLVELQIIQ